MPKKKPTPIGNGLASLRGQNEWINHDREWYHDREVVWPEEFPLEAGEFLRLADLPFGLGHRLGAWAKQEQSRTILWLYSHKGGYVRSYQYKKGYILHLRQRPRWGLRRSNLGQP
jgi:hypothetical protein